MQRLKMLGVATGLVCSLGASAQAADPSARPATPTTAAAKTATTAHPTSSAKPVAPTVAGTLTVIDLQSSTPSMQVKKADGQLVQLGVDAQSTTVWQNGRSIPLNQLTMGQSVKVRYSDKNGKSIAKAILVQPAASSGSRAPSSTPAASSPTTH